MLIPLGQVSSGCRLLNLCNHTLVVALDCLGGKMPGRQKAWHLRRPLHYLLGRLHLMILHSNHLCIVAGMRWEAFLRSCLLTEDLLMAMQGTCVEMRCPLRGKHRHAVSQDPYDITIQLSQYSSIVWVSIVWVSIVWVSKWWST
jgi:hypothetical protein